MQTKNLPLTTPEPNLSYSPYYHYRYHYNHHVYYYMTMEVTSQRSQRRETLLFLNR